MAYEQYRLLAETLNELPRVQRDIFCRCTFPESKDVERPLPEASLDDLTAAFTHILQRMKQDQRHKVLLESMSVREQMHIILQQLEHGSRTLSDMLRTCHHREAWVTTLLAMLELWRQRIIRVLQQGGHHGAIVLMKSTPDDAEAAC